MNFSGIKVGTYIVLRDKFACKVTSVAFSKPGKHGGAKKVVTGIDVITDKKHEQSFHHGSVITVPSIVRTTFPLNYIEDNEYLHVTNSLQEQEMHYMDANDANGIPQKLIEAYEQGSTLDVTMIFVKPTEDSECQTRVVAFSESK